MKYYSYTYQKVVAFCGSRTSSLASSLAMKPVMKKAMKRAVKTAMVQDATHMTYKKYVFNGIEQILEALRKAKEMRIEQDGTSASPHLDKALAGVSCLRAWSQAWAEDAQRVGCREGWDKCMLWQKTKKGKATKAHMLAHPHYGNCNPCCITSGGRGDMCCRR
jgi:hypothetical protein